MSMTRIFSGNRYEVVAFANEQESIYYHEFGSYQGEWLMVAKDNASYFIYKGWYGSCSGCDSYEAFFDWNDQITIDKAREFVGSDGDYRAFLVVPIETMRNVVSGGKLLTIIPANIADQYSDINLEEAAHDIAVKVKVLEGLPITSSDVIKTVNAEIKQEALASLGYENFVAEMNPKTLDKLGEDELIQMDDITMLHVKDASTPRRYLLRVPNNMERVKQAVAWTFGLREDEYNPIAET